MIQKSRIAVIGCTGKSGSFLLNELLRQEYPVTILLRNPENFRIKNPLIEIVKGDATDFESVQTLVKDCKALISTLGQTKKQSPIFSKAAENIIKAMNVANISRYIVVTGMVLDTPFDKKSTRTKILSGIMKIMFPSIIADKRKEYALLSGSSLDWTMVRVPMINPTDARGKTETSLKDCPGNKISTADLASFLIGQLTDKTFIRQAPFLANK